MTSFSNRLKIAIQAHGPLCVGIDPSGESLRACGLPDSAEGALEFGQRIVASASGCVALVKPQSAYFERFGAEGGRALETIIATARARSLLVLLDAKRGDIDATAEAYAHAYFSPSSPIRVDAITVHAYLGFGALRPLTDYATVEGGGVFVVVRSSNPEGALLQSARLADGQTVAQHIAGEITKLNGSRPADETHGPIGAVVGATLPDAGDVAADLPYSYLLAPGIGAQGARLEDVAFRFGAARSRVLPSVSRAILAQGSSPAEIETVIRCLAEKAKRLLFC